MRIALLNPAWNFANSIYFGCREAHLPLELGYAAALLEAVGHEVLMLDGALMGESNAALSDRIAAFAPAMTVLTTAPTYLFWRCTQPELRVPRAVLAELGARGGTTVAIGPHGSVTPETTLHKLGCDIVLRGEAEDILPRLAEALARQAPLRDLPALCFRDGAAIVVTGAPHAGRFVDLPALRWPAAWLARHGHHHHRYGGAPHGLGAEVEASRGCPYSCSFCAKIDFRDGYRRRDTALVLEEIDGLIAGGVAYVYFIDEIFLPRGDLLAGLAERPVEFGIQTRIDVWKPEMLDRLGAAGCVSIEAGIESLSVAGRASLDKACRLSTEALTARLIHARRSVPFVQANLIAVAGDDAAEVAAWRRQLLDHGIWANDPVPLYPYPASPDYHKLWGAPDGEAWERAHRHYLAQFQALSDIQAADPWPLPALEADCRPCGAMPPSEAL